MAHFYSGPLRSVLLVSVLLGNLAVVPDLFATPPQPPDASRRLYDRVMEEFRHKDYNAALAGFRFFPRIARSIDPLSECPVLDG